MESRFGHDFSRVRVHTDPLAARSAEAVAAQAYTVGSDVVFGVGRYAPASRDGQRLLAHELAHVVQQSVRELSHALPADARIDAPGNAMNDETHRGTAGNVAKGPGIARQPKAPPTPPKAPSTPTTVFHPRVMHNHTPSGRWADVQAAPNSTGLEGAVCKRFDPATVMFLAGVAELGNKLIASDHLGWFLKHGGGADYVEDSNLDSMLRRDSKIQAVLRALIPTDRSSGTFVSRVEIRQDDYAEQDFRFAFGAIDRLDFEANFDPGTLHVWFQDRYEWHPVYPFYTNLPGDKVRTDNCVHAAGVELKSGNARDYWMKGEATIPLTALQSAAYHFTPQIPIK